MSGGLLDPVVLLKKKMLDLEISNRALAHLAGVTEATLSTHLGGSNRIDLFTWRRIEALMINLQRISEMAAPLPLDFKKTDRVERLLKAMEDGRLEISVKTNPDYQESNEILGEVTL